MTLRMHRSLSFFLALIPLLFCLSAQAGRAKAIPAPQGAHSALPSADSAIRLLAVSHPYPNTDARVVSDDDLIAREIAAIQALCADAAGTSASAAEKELIIARYEMGFAPIVDALIAAKTSGCIGRITLITDLNESMEAEFKKGERHHSRFSEATIKDNPMGRELTKLRAAGFHFGQSPYQIVSQPLYGPGASGEEERHPLMHQKQLLAILGAGPQRRVVRDMNSTHNWTNNPRFNRLMEGAEPLLAAYHLAYLDAMATGYRAGRTTSEIPEIAPLRVTYADGSFAEAAYTQGRFELNRRKVDYVLKNMLDKIKADPANNAMLGEWASHFVNTNGAVLRAKQELMDAAPGWETKEIYDAKFVSLDDWGITAAEAGYPVFRPGDAPDVRGFKKALRDRIHAYVYIRGVEGRDETDPEGPPIARWVWHDKTHIYHVKEDGLEWAYVFTGSYNNSGNFANAELQTVYKFPAASPMAHAFIQSVERPLEIAIQEGHAVPLSEYVVTVDAIAQLTGHSPKDIKETYFAQAQGIVSDLKAGRMDEARAALTALVDANSHLTQRHPTEARHKAVATFLSLVSWYRGLENALRLDNITLGILMAPLAFELTGGEVRFGFERALWSPQLSKEDLESRVKAAWDLLGRNDALPPPWVPKERRGIAARVTALAGAPLNWARGLWQRATANVPALAGNVCREALMPRPHRPWGSNH